MQDRVPVNPGRVLVTPENGGAAYYATLTRADNPTQEGTPLNKASLLKDTTAALFGLGADAVPDDAFALLSRLHAGLGNEYVWAKQQTGVVPVAGTSSYTGMNFNNYVKVSSSVTISNGVITQVSPTEMLISSATDLQKLVGKYVWAKVFTNSAYNNVITYAPNVALSGSTIMLQNIEIGSVVLGYVNSPDPTAYPPAVSDGFTYSPLGQLGEKTKIATGSYTGTGTKGASNPCSLTFGFRPQLVLVGKKIIINNNILNEICAIFKVFAIGESYEQFSYTLLQSQSIYSSNKMLAKVVGNTLYWYADSSAYQMNETPGAYGQTYTYFAIG